jgi:hypothetical protein
LNSGERVGYKAATTTGKIPALLKRNGMLLALEKSSYSVKARLTAAKPGWYISLILIGFKLGSKILMHAT